MATKVMNFKMDEQDITAMKEVASVFHITMTDVVRDAVHEYIERMKADPFYRLTANVEDASAEETEEILSEIDGLTDDDLTISSTRQFTV